MGKPDPVELTEVKGQKYKGRVVSSMYPRRHRAAPPRGTRPFPNQHNGVLNAASVLEG